MDCSRQSGLSCWGSWCYRGLLASGRGHEIGNLVFLGSVEGAVLQLTICFHHNTFRATIVTIHSPVAKPGVPCMASFPNILSRAQLSQSSTYTYTSVFENRLCVQLIQHRCIYACTSYISQIPTLRNMYSISAHPEFTHAAE